VNVFFFILVRIYYFLYSLIELVEIIEVKVSGGVNFNFGINFSPLL